MSTLDVYDNGTALLDDTKLYRVLGICTLRGASLLVLDARAGIVLFSYSNGARLRTKKKLTNAWRLQGEVIETNLDAPAYLLARHPSAPIIDPKEKR